MAWRDFLAVDLESEVDTNRSDRRLEPKPNPAALRNLPRSTSVACLNTLPVSRKPTTPTLRITPEPQFGVQDHHAVSPDRKSVGIDHLGSSEPVKGETANGGVAAGKEALACGQLHAGP